LVFDVAVFADVPDIAGGVIKNCREIATAVKVFAYLLLSSPTG
jgi:hypothetical protein